MLTPEERIELVRFVVDYCKKTDQINDRNVRLSSATSKARLRLKNGDTRLVEFYYGQGFNAQSSRRLELNDQVQEILLLDRDGAIIDSISPSPEQNESQ